MRKPQPILESHTQRGFTLIELMVTLAVAALLLGIAVPSFRDMSIRNRLTTAANDLITTINYARSESVRRGRAISICASNDGATCGGTWSEGRIVFVNNDNDSPIEIDAGTDTVLRIDSGLDSNYAIGADAAFGTGVTYGPDGAASNTGIFAVCHDGSTSGSRAVVVTRLRPRVAKDTDNDRIPNRDDGDNIASCDSPGS